MFKNVGIDGVDESNIEDIKKAISSANIGEGLSGKSAVQKALKSTGLTAKRIQEIVDKILETKLSKELNEFKSVVQASQELKSEDIGTDKYNKVKLDFVKTLQALVPVETNDAIKYFSVDNNNGKYAMRFVNKNTIREIANEVKVLKYSITKVDSVLEGFNALIGENLVIEDPANIKDIITNLNKDNLIKLDGIEIKFNWYKDPVQKPYTSVDNVYDYENNIGFDYNTGNIKKGYVDKEFVVSISFSKNGYSQFSKKLKIKINKAQADQEIKKLVEIITEAQAVTEETQNKRVELEKRFIEELINLGLTTKENSNNSIYFTAKGFNYKSATRFLGKSTKAEIEKEIKSIDEDKKIVDELSNRMDKIIEGISPIVDTENYAEIFKVIDKNGELSEEMKSKGIQYSVWQRDTSGEFVDVRNLHENGIGYDIYGNIKKGDKDVEFDALMKLEKDGVSNNVFSCKTFKVKVTAQK